MSGYLEVADQAYRALQKSGFGRDHLGPVLKPLPSRVRRMGLVRCLEGLELGKHKTLGKALHEQLIAPQLHLRPTIAEAVQELETCERRILFERHTKAIALFDALA